MKRSTRALRIALAAALSLAAPAAAVAQAQPTARGGAVVDLRGRLAGPAFRFAGGDQERAALRDAIATAVSHMNFIARPVARGRLNGRNPVYDWISFQFPANSVEVSMAGRSPIRSPDDGSVAPNRAITGEAIRVSQRFEGNRLVQVLTSNEGERRNEFTVSPDGRTLTMHVAVSSPQLPNPLRYRLTYARR